MIKQQQQQQSTKSLLLSRDQRRSNEDFYDDADDDDDKDADDDDYYNSSSSYYEEDDNGRDNTGGKSRRREQQQRRTSASDDNYYGREDDDGGGGGEPGNNSTSTSRGGYYQVYFNEEVDPSETELDWEVCSSSSSDSDFDFDGKDDKINALVLLPPAAVERPTAIVHFVGGTFFGSNPKLWYRSLLESIVRSTSVAVVVTPIPVTLFKNPLQHIRLSQKISKSFRHAWFTVLEDEYGADVLRDIPLCGLGHSLGARLLTVLTTLDQNKSPRDEEEKRRNNNKNNNGRARARSQSQSEAQQLQPPPYKSLCLVSFTNYGAKVGIPGVAALLKESNKREEYNKINNSNKNNGERQRSRKRSRSRSRSRDGYDGYDGYEYNDYDNVDEEWSELVGDLQETVNEQANRLKTALTPFNAEDLEFFPSPDQLWKAIQEDGRYNVNSTLIVQFDDDPIDQSSKLAHVLHTTNSSDVRFARLRGNHLTPVSVNTNGDDDDSSSGSSSSSKRRQNSVAAAANIAGGGLGGLGSLIEKTIKGNNKNRQDKIAMRDLRQSIISYIADVVTK